MNINILVKLQFILFATIFIAEAKSLDRLNSFQNDSIPTVSYCELIAEPERYARKTVRIRGIYAVSFEVATLEGDAGCQCQNKHLVGVKFQDSYQANTKKRVLQKFKKLLEVKNNAWGKERRVAVVLIGQFNGEREKIISENGTITPKYDGIHKYQFIVNQIESAAKLKP